MIKILDKYSKVGIETGKCHKSPIFKWNQMFKDYVEMIEGTKIYEWLYPIKFKFILALVLEEMQSNMEDILHDRENTLQMICNKLNMSEEKLYSYIEYIQELLIRENKVKISKDCSIIIMNKI